jgi:hypothetical protein
VKVSWIGKVREQIAYAFKNLLHISLCQLMLFNSSCLATTYSHNRSMNVEHNTFLEDLYLYTPLLQVVCHAVYGT